jgi:hypothetical protein
MKSKDCTPYRIGYRRLLDSPPISPLCGETPERVNASTTTSLYEEFGNDGPSADAFETAQDCRIACLTGRYFEICKV